MPRPPRRWPPWPPTTALLILLFVLGPAVGWVLFNIARPAFNQISKMVNAANSGAAPAKKPASRFSKAKKGVIGAIGLSSAMALIPENAEAAQEMATLAADNRPLILLFVMGPAVGWVLFNIARPAFNQISKMVNAATIRSFQEEEVSNAGGLFDSFNLHYELTVQEWSAYKRTDLLQLRYVYAFTLSKSWLKA